MKRGKNRPVHAVEFPSEYLPDPHVTGDALVVAQLEPAGQSAAEKTKTNNAMARVLKLQSTTETSR
jgi:hypothetical protein